MTKRLARAFCLLGMVMLLAASFARAQQPELLVKLLASDGALDDLFGSSIAMDGDTAVIASPWDDDNGEFSGSVYVFTLKDGAWSEQAKLVPSDGVPHGVFGYSVAIDADTAVIGALRNPSGWGAAYVFTRTDDVWTEQAKLLPSDGTEIDYLGHSVAIDGDTVIVGAPDWNHYVDPGSAYIFTRTENVWTQQAKLEVAGIQAGHKFGHEVTLDGDTAIVGAFGVGPDYRGAAYVFTRVDGVWIQQSKLQPAQSAANDYFGFGVVVEGDTAVIGAPKDATNGDSAGAVYLFTRRAGVWTQQAKLLARDGASPDWFGKVVAIDGDTLLIGAPYDDDNGWWSGSAYLFRRTTRDWTEQAKILAKDGRPEDGFGFALGIDDDTAIIGAAWEIAGPGSAYVFRQNDGQYGQRRAFSSR